MAFQRKGKGLQGEKLNIIHKNILRVIQTLKKKKRFNDMNTLFELCCADLPNPEPEIYKAINELYEMNYIVEGTQLLKGDILSNKTRRLIYEYVLANPGAHEREIRSNFGLGSYISYRHLNFLVKFEFLRKTTYKNKATYFDSNLNELQDIPTLLLRDETTNQIYQCIQEHEKLRLVDLENLLRIPYTTIQNHIIKLLEGELIQKMKVDGIVHYELAIKMPPEDFGIEIKREFDFIGGQVRFKIAVRNLSELAIHNIAVSLNPSDQFIPDGPQQVIANLPPNTTRGLDFVLTPITCGRSMVFGSTSYQDARGKVHCLPIQPKEIQIKCPLVQPQLASQSEVNEWIKNLKRGTSKISFHNIPEAEAFRIGCQQVSALDLSEVSVNSDEKFGIYSGQVKLTGQNMVVRVTVAKPSIILDVWTDDNKQTTGFLAYIINLINLALESSYKIFQKTEDITQKIAHLMKAVAVIDRNFKLFEEKASICDVSDNLENLNNLLLDAACDEIFLQSVENEYSTLRSEKNPETPIQEKFAIELQFKSLKWSQKIQDLVKYHLNTYQETFDDLTHVSDKIMTGINLMSEKIKEQNRCYGLRILAYMLILDKKSGITLYEKNMGEMKINPDLVGGFLHAIHSFGTEISSPDDSMKTLTYENYRFQFETGNYIRAALILRGPANQFIITQFKDFVHQFEQNFEDDIKNFSGNMDTFKPANALIQVIFS